MDSLLFFTFKVTRSQEKSVPGAPGNSLSLQKKESHVSGVKIFYGSQTGTAKVRALNNASALVSQRLKKIPETSFSSEFISLAVLLLFSLRSFLEWWMASFCWAQCLWVLASKGPEALVCLWRMEILALGIGRGLQAHPTLRHCDMTL